MPLDPEGRAEAIAVEPRGRRAWMGLLAAAIAAVALGACGGDDDRRVAPDSAPSSGPEGGERSASKGSEDEARLTGRRGIALRRIGEFRNPTHIAQPPGVRDLLFVTEKRGVVGVLRGDRRLRRPFLDLRDQVRHEGTEQGLLSIAFPPNYRHTRRFYVAYTNRSHGDLRIDELRRSRKHRTVARRVTRRNLMAISQPYPNHNGGLLVFGPDRRLYIGVGDGGPSYDPDNRGQDLRSLLGTILRIEPRGRERGRPYGIPRGNPFRGRGRAEIFAYGLRNPWRFSFDRRTGALLIGDVGQDLVEEVNFVRPKRARGAKFGWPGWEGTRPFKRGQQRRGAIPPLHEYLHRNGRCSITGGYVVRDPSLRSLRGRYLYGDFCTGEIRSLVPPTDGDQKDDRGTGLVVPQLASFGEDDRGRIYVVSLAGPIYRLVQR